MTSSKVETIPEKKPASKFLGRPLPLLARQLLTQFETKTALDQLHDCIGEIQAAEMEVVDTQKVISAANMTMETIRAKLTVAGLEGSTEKVRQAALEVACRDDALYMRAVTEQEQAMMKRETAEIMAGNAKRRYRAITLEIEARISSKYLMAGILRLPESSGEV